LPILLVNDGRCLRMTIGFFSGFGTFDFPRAVALSPIKFWRSTRSDLPVLFPGFCFYSLALQLSFNDQFRPRKMKRAAPVLCRDVLALFAPTISLLISCW